MLLSTLGGAIGIAYIDILCDLDILVSADSAFLLGPWLEGARRWGTNSSDCRGNAVGIQDCEDFYESWPALEDFLFVCGFLMIPWPFLESGGVQK